MSSEFARALEAEMAAITEEIRWRFLLDWNEYLWGSAHGPWQRPEFKGLEVLL
jgi:hypothetical protein